MRDDPSPRIWYYNLKTGHLYVWESNEQNEFINVQGMNLAR